jgi:hypothetical protein
LIKEEFKFGFGRISLTLIELENIKTEPCIYILYACYKNVATLVGKSLTVISLIRDAALKPLSLIFSPTGPYPL